MKEIIQQIYSYQLTCYKIPIIAPRNKPFLIIEPGPIVYNSIESSA